MKNIIAIFVWLALLPPSLVLGKAWQSHSVPGVVVSVQFPSGSIEGRILYDLNGSTWLVEDGGVRHQMSDAEVVSSTAPTKTESNDYSPLKYWRLMVPMAVWAACFFVLIGWSKKSKITNN